MLRTSWLFLILILLFSCARQTTGSTASQNPAAGRIDAFESTPVWQDEFNYKGLPDSAKWGYDVGGHGWGNNEAQYYTRSINNASVDDGKLTITARKEAMEEKGYTSARLVSKNKGDFLYGRIEVRAKLPPGRGTWPAIWLLPTDWAYGNWPASGEIDIMEHVGYDPARVLFSVHTEAYNHTKGTQKSGEKNIPSAMSDFHLYRVDWMPDSLKGYFDNELIFSFGNERKGHQSWPFDKRFHILLNLAIGGNWGGQKGIDDAIFPARFEIDYVRVYRMTE